VGWHGQLPTIHSLKSELRRMASSLPIRNRSERVLLAADDGFASFGFSQSVETPRSAAGKRQVKEYKAEQDREIAAVEDRQETSRRMPEKIGKRHLTRENERNGTGEEAQYEQCAADEFDRSGKAEERKPPRKLCEKFLMYGSVANDGVNKYEGNPPSALAGTADNCSGSGSPHGQPTSRYV